MQHASKDDPEPDVVAETEQEALERVFKCVAPFPSLSLSRARSTLTLSELTSCAHAHARRIHERGLRWAGMRGEDGA